MSIMESVGKFRRVHYQGMSLAALVVAGAGFLALDWRGIGLGNISLPSAPNLQHAQTALRRRAICIGELVLQEGAANPRVVSVSSLDHQPNQSDISFSAHTAGNAYSAAAHMGSKDGSLDPATTSFAIISSLPLAGSATQPREA